MPLQLSLTHKIQFFTDLLSCDYVLQATSNKLHINLFEAVTQKKTEQDHYISEHTAK